MQLGPHNLMPALAAFSKARFWSLMPSSPASLNPPDSIIIPLAPFLAHSLTVCGSSLEGIKYMARSILPGIESYIGIAGDS